MIIIHRGCSFNTLFSVALLCTGIFRIELRGVTDWYHSLIILHKNVLPLCLHFILLWQCMYFLIFCIVVQLRLFLTNPQKAKVTQEQNSDWSCTATLISPIRSVSLVEVGSNGEHNVYHFLGFFFGIQWWQRLEIVCLMLLTVMLLVSTDMSYLRNVFSGFMWLIDRLCDYVWFITNIKLTTAVFFVSAKTTIIFYIRLRK